MRVIILLILLISSLRHINALNPIPILERKVTIKITSQPLGKVLNIISETADFNFSYGNQVVKVNKLVTIHAENRSVREVLDQLFNNEVSYQQIGNHLILQKRLMPKHTNKVQAGEGRQVKYHFVISGYLRDMGSGDGIPNVSVYEKQTLSNTLSGDFGYYQLSITSKAPEITLWISRKDYLDTSLKINFENNGLAAVNINLQNQFTIPAKENIEVKDSLNLIASSDTPIIAKPDTSATRIVWQDSTPRKSIFKKINVEETQFGKWFINSYQRIIEKNIRDSFQRKWQLAFVTPVSSNGTLSGLVTNMVSLNVLAGYNGGLNGVEFGGLVNILRHEMLGAQFAGLGNIVGGNVTGVQFGGLFNTDFANFKGFQGAGLLNHNYGDFSGVQAAGLYNYNNSLSDGVQLAGLLNGSRGGMKGLQIAGIGNLAAKSSDLVQVAGVFNLANRINGGQIGVINIAGKINGFQLGIMNIADSSKGLAIGIINFIKDGTHQLEMSMNEMSQYGLAYRSGTKTFYSNIMVTTQLPMLDTNTLMSCGFGVGTRIKISNTFCVTLDVASHQQTFNFRSESLNLMSRLNANLEIKLIKGVAVFGGVSLCHFIADTRDSRYETTFRDFGNKAFWRQGGLYDRHAWVGYQFGLRLF